MINYYIVAQIVTNKSNAYKLQNVSIRQYSYSPAVTSIIVDYRVATGLSDKYPFIVGKCNISTPNERNMLSRTLTGAVSFDKLQSLSGVFTDGFTIDSNYSSEEDIKQILPEYMKINKSKTIWNVGF